MIWVAVGGRGTLVGAILGAILVNLGKTFFTSAHCPNCGSSRSGALFILVTLFLPQGVMGLFAQARTRATRQVWLEAQHASSLQRPPLEQRRMTADR